MPYQAKTTGPQFTMLLVVAYQASGIFTFPARIVEEAERGAILSIVLSALFAYGSSMLVAWMGLHFPRLTGIEWGEQIFPPWLNRTLAMLAVIVHVGAPLVVLRLFGMLLREIFFQITPIWLLTAGLVLVAAYGAVLGVEVLGRVAVIMAPLLLSTVVVAYLLAFPDFELYRLRPITLDPLPILRGTFKSTLHYEGVAALYLLQAHLAKPERVFRYLTISFGISTLIFVLMYVATVSTFTVNGLLTVTWPAPQLLMLVRMGGWFIERLGLFIQVVWAGLVLLYCAVHLWATARATQQLLGLKPKLFPWVVGTLMMLYLGATLYPVNIAYLKWWQGLLPWGCLYSNFVLALLQYTVGMARGVFRRQEGVNSGA